jgi:hypothetical protein
MAKITATDEWQTAVRNHIDKLDADEKRQFAHTLIFDIALWTGYNTYEMIGLLEVVKIDLLDTLTNSEEDDD